MSASKTIGFSCAAALASALAPAYGAETFKEALTEGDTIVDLRARYESVEQGGFTSDAEALTTRLRAGFQTAPLKGTAFLAEGVIVEDPVDDYNSTTNGQTEYPVVADPADFAAVNRFAIINKSLERTTLTFGRQRIIHDDARFVGNVGWRQNEQTFDALRGQARFGQFTLDATYSISQRTVFGVDSPNEHFDGDLVFLNGGVDTKHLDAKAFAYLLDYDARLAFSSQTYGVLVTGELPIAGFGKLTGLASYAAQDDYGGNPVNYGADYINAQLGLGFSGFTLTAGYEELGSDHGVAAFQTPLATLHAFNGWADLFLTTPANGLRDYYAGIARIFAVPFLPGLKADVTYHEFDSDFGALEYGSEWDASLGFKAGPVNLLAKYANFDSAGFAADTEKFWLQAEIGF